MKPRVATVPILMLLPQTLPTPLRAVPKQWSGPSTSCASNLATGSPSQLSSPRSKPLPLPVDLTSVVRVQASASANAKIRKLVGTGAVEAEEAQAVDVPLAWFEVAVTLHSDVIVTANENATAMLHLHHLHPVATALLPPRLAPVTALALALVAVVDTADAHPPI